MKKLLLLLLIFASCTKEVIVEVPVLNPVNQQLQNQINQLQDQLNQSNNSLSSLNYNYNQALGIINDLQGETDYLESQLNTAIDLANIFSFLLLTKVDSLNSNLTVENVFYGNGYANVIVRYRDTPWGIIVQDNGGGLYDVAILNIETGLITQYFNKYPLWTKDYQEAIITLGG